MSVMLGVMGETGKGSRRSVRRRPSAAARPPHVPGDHQPVMVAELLQTLTPAPGETAVDATLGGGGTSAALLQHVLPGGRVLALDRDPAAVSQAALRFGAMGEAFHAVVASFSGLQELADEQGIQADVVVMDLGISSIQLDNPERGFSFQSEGPLDMRLDPSDGGPTAADLLADMDEPGLARLLFDFGQERHARAISRAVVERRRVAPVLQTTDLAALCAGAIPRRLWPPHIHPATRTFMALRIAVNNELDELSLGISAAVQILRPGGRLGIISFHSLEDTVAKRSLHNLALTCVCPPQQPICTCAHRATLFLPRRKAIKPTDDEVARNPRARSALLRTAVKLAVEAP
ncbi:MAG TPA: 16S rRNA (cytosine(1402)-N(4))-methyltransferase RsmH [Candidatus Dormibacteraeota bacterium]|nr:16S rRNA (cytosine(1402)-N(4))-methyltransferase RsmH [Candidatus Dormibacteraeota bacterium]HVD02630.1 16S rRNA (cytosine(1402)-N(4))-methyltransferase RsmH [Candidatus Dormibacteraeota bacterium]